MTRIMWKYIKDEIITHLLDLNIQYFDLGIEHRDQNNDQVNEDASKVIRECGVGIKFATLHLMRPELKSLNSKK
jgi:isocitrate dehydrogenase